MRHIYITINTKDVILKIQTHAYYIGETRKDSGVPVRLAADIQVSENDNRQISDHLDITCNELSKLISRYLSLCNIKEVTEEECSKIRSYSLFLPYNYPMELIEEVKQAMINYAVIRTIQLWLMQCKPDEAPLIANEVYNTSINLRELLAMRKRPQKERHKNKKYLDV